MPRQYSHGGRVSPGPGRAAGAPIPAFLGETHSNAQGYEIAWRRTPARRELDYLRTTGASVETAKE